MTWTYQKDKGYGRDHSMYMLPVASEERIDINDCCGLWLSRVRDCMGTCISWNLDMELIYLSVNRECLNLQYVPRGCGVRFMQSVPDTGQSGLLNYIIISTSRLPLDLTVSLGELHHDEEESNRCR